MIGEVQSRLGRDFTKKKVDELVDGLFGAIGQAVKADGRYSHPGFGIFAIKDRAARAGRNPQTGKPIQISARKTCIFKAASALKASL